MKGFWLLVLIFIVLCALNVQPPDDSYSGGNVSLKNKNNTNAPAKKVALTFDGGASDASAHDILNALRKKHVKCTMFLTGPFIEKYPEVVKRIVQDGHEVGNHTWSHPSLTTYADNGHHYTRREITRGLLQKELRDTGNIFYRTTGKRMANLWRAPFGEHNTQLEDWAGGCGFRHHIRWTLDTFDWMEPGHPKYYLSTQKQIFKRVAFHVRDNNKSIILMHLGADRPYAKLLPALIDGLRNMGCELVEVSDLT